MSTPLTEDQRAGIAERLNELQGLRRTGRTGGVDAGLALEAVRQVLEVLGHRMAWVDGAWTVEEG